MRRASSPDETPLGSIFPGTAEARRDVHARAVTELDKVKMLDAADRYPSELSYGKQKLISIARALMNDGNCLLLDEPMAGVEGPAYDAIKDLVRGEAEAGRGSASSSTTSRSSATFATAQCSCSTGASWRAEPSRISYAIRISPSSISERDG